MLSTETSTFVNKKLSQGSRTAITSKQYFHLTMFMVYIFHETVISWHTSRAVMCKGKLWQSLLKKESVKISS